MRSLTVLVYHKLSPFFRIAMPIEVVVKDACRTIGEGPHWDEASQSLYYVDIDDKSVSRWNSVTGENEKITLGTIIILY